MSWLHPMERADRSPEMAAMARAYAALLTSFGGYGENDDPVPEWADNIFKAAAAADTTFTRHDCMTDALRAEKAAAYAAAKAAHDAAAAATAAALAAPQVGALPSNADILAAIAANSGNFDTDGIYRHFGITSADGQSAIRRMLSSMDGRSITTNRRERWVIKGAK